MKVLSNVFISSGNNKLQLVDVYFDKMIGEIDFRLTEGSNPEIQLTALLAHLVGLQLK